MARVDIDDTSACPLGVRCESCGDERGNLTVWMVAFDRLGVACLTLCPRCAGSSVVPPVAVRLVEQHCGHLSNTVDDMDALLKGGDR